MSSDLKRVTETARELGLNLGEMQAVMKTIDQIAFQANLLARCIVTDTALAGQTWQGSAVIPK